MLIGHAGHPEVEGTMGRFDTAHGGRIHLVRERRRRRAARGARSRSSSRSSRRPRCRSTTPRRSSTRCARASRRLPAPRQEDICYATQNRQDAVKKLLRAVRRAAWSSARAPAPTPTACASSPSGPAIPGYLVDGADDLQPRVVRRQARGRRHGRRLGAGGAGAAGGRAAARPGAGRRRRRSPAARSTWSSRCRASCGASQKNPCSSTKYTFRCCAGSCGMPSFRRAPPRSCRNCSGLYS